VLGDTAEADNLSIRKLVIGRHFVGTARHIADEIDRYGRPTRATGSSWCRT
jgi:hypothetical protein